jgi:DNA polymerase-3 subunit epsilon
MKQRYVSFDVETTGLYPQRGDRIIEVGAVSLEDGTVVDEFHSFLNAGKLIPLTAQKIHGIHGEMLTGKPGPEEVMPRFMAFISNSVLIAHNAKFDMTFLRYELARLGRSLPNRYLCTLEIIRKAYPELPNYRLETVYNHLLGDLAEGSRRHRAIDDARLVARIWLEFERRKGLLGQFLKRDG